MLYFLSLYFILQILSFSLLPLTAKLFSSLSDKGYAFSKSVSLVIVGFIVWFLVSLNLFKFSQTTILVIFLFLAFISLVFTAKHKIPRLSRRQVLYIIFIEILFLIIFSFTAYLKYRTSPIQGTEKPMDFALINGIFRSEYFPPNDAWYAGQPINYYYYGHYLIAFLAKFADISTRVIYTLALPLVFSLTGLNVFGLVFNIMKNKKHAIIFGLLAVVLVLFGANFDTPVQIIKSLISGIKLEVSWWDPSRVIGRGFLENSYLTITEFPYFSLLLGDVHAHVLALVLGSLFLGVCFAFFKQLTIPIVIFGSLVLASLAMTNPWELPGYILLVFFVLVFSPLKLRGGLGGVIIGLVSLVFFSFPFFNNFEMIRAVNDPKPFITFISNVSLIGRRTLLSEFLTIWGTHLVIIGIALVIIIKKLSPPRFLFLKLPHFRPPLTPEIIFSLLVFAVGITLIIFSEFFFVNDIFTPPLDRMNTIFKFYYQSWLILGIGGPALLGLIWSDFSQIQKNLIATILGVLIAGNLTYFITATPNRVNNFPKNSKSLDGLYFLEGSADPGDIADAAAIKWLNYNVSGQPNLVESIIDPLGGNSYNRIGRISAATGLPSPMGWLSSEAVWHNSSPEVNQRISDINTIYGSKNMNEIKSLITKYKIKFIYVGQIERGAYPGTDFTKFTKIGQLVFSHSPSQIYEIPEL